MSERRRIKHTATFGQRLANEAERIKTEAKELPQGKEREDMMRARPGRPRLHLRSAHGCSCRDCRSQLKSPNRAPV